MKIYQIAEVGPDGMRPGASYTNFQRACQAATVRASDLGQRPSNTAAQVVVLDGDDNVVRAIPVLCRVPA